ncbi:hypothetical protein SISNIDRAFT_463220 [Sistotremastrum niveocremeum HHB9708]|uniref:Uncharacterized protein n=1 Tax=Sistotremastrum niveocremeum HHB9708 TaxID=1314777 RepID=A0A164YWE8_9AGAM|nr:hypothetical protein SISNIDRAFT_463220 [Sistotremastrum niveocremeum HHB9708]
MSASPVVRRSSNASGSLSPPSTDGLVNWYEAEEERIINLLSRKLEQLREEKIALENTLEAESESQVNRLNRELSVLRRQQQQQQQSQSQQGGQNGVDAAQPAPATSDPRYPSSEIMLDAMRRENESLRTRLMDIENDYIRMRRLNEVYREELIEHRRRRLRFSCAASAWRPDR